MTKFISKRAPSPEPVPEKVQPKQSFLKKKSEMKEPEKKEEEKSEGEMFKLKKKSSVTPRKQIQKEEEQPAFAGFKLKKAETVKRGWADSGMEKVDLKHHEFEKRPQDEQVTLTRLINSKQYFYNLLLLISLKEHQGWYYPRVFQKKMMAMARKKRKRR